jgi:hypothetical protein
VVQRWTVLAMEAGDDHRLLLAGGGRRRGACASWTQDAVHALRELPPALKASAQGLIARRPAVAARACAGVGAARQQPSVAPEPGRHCSQTARR